jgi:NADP-dependent 3-hydroxy acid dehydrogenase YdfG
MQDRVALITGASRGIGELTAYKLADLGMTTVLTARTESELQRVAHTIEQAGGRASIYPADVSGVSAAQALIEHVQQRFGRLDVLVNNAGVGHFVPIIHSDPDDWWRVMEVNLQSMFLVTRFALPLMLAQDSGHIVNLLSIAGKRPFRGMSAYCASKAAGLMFTQVLASEVRAQGIRVTAVVPGAARTAIWDGLENPPDPTQMMPPERVADAILYAITQPDDCSIDEILIMPPKGVI